MQARSQAQRDWLAAAALGMCSISASQTGCSQHEVALAQTTRALELPDCAALGEALVGHACTHAVSGPFMTVSAAVDAATQPAPVNNVHTHYTITLPAGESGAHSGVVRYRPQRSGDWVIFADREIPLKVSDAAGAELPLVYSEAPTTCPELPFAKSFQLTSGVTYLLSFGPSQAAEVALVIEKVDDFIQTYFADKDADGEGDPSATLVSACVPPDGVVDNDTDCDDERKDVNTAAAERCDELDNDCDTRIDEQLSCEDAEAPKDADAAPARAAAGAPDAGQPKDAGRAEPAAAPDAGSALPSEADGGTRERDARDAGAPVDAAIDDIMEEALMNRSGPEASSDNSGGCQVATVGASRLRSAKPLMWLTLLIFGLFRNRKSRFVERTLRHVPYKMSSS